MNTDLLAISNIFAGTSGIGPEPVKSTSTRGNKQFSSPIFDNRPLNDSPGTETLNVTLVNPDNVPKKGNPSEFALNPDTNMSQKSENSKKATKQNPTTVPAGQPSVVQAWLAKYSLNIAQGKKGVARRVEPKAGYELAQSLKNPREEIAFAHIVKPTKIQISETVPILKRNQIRLKSTLPVTSKKPSNEGEQPNGIQISSMKPPASRGDADRQSGKVPSLKSPIDAQSGTNTSNGKPAVADKPVVASSRKAPALNSSFSPVQNKSSYLQSQPVRIGPEKSLLFAEKAASHKTTPSQQGTILPEPSIDNKAAGKLSPPGTHRLLQPPAEEGIEQSKNSPGNPAPKKLHQTQLHVFTSQTKEHGSLASNNKSDSGFQQILTPDNTETFLTEQTSAFPEGAKTDNIPSQTSPSDVSAGITKQILESIHSTSPQQAGTQEITIRLNPPELGKVFIKFEEQENQITGLLEVSKTQTRYEIEHALPQIIQNLADCGIQVKRLEVILTDQGEQQPYRDELLQDGTFQQHHGFPEGDNPDNHGTIRTNEPIIGLNSSGYQDGFEPQAQITDNSIDMLI